MRLMYKELSSIIFLFSAKTTSLTFSFTTPFSLASTYQTYKIFKYPEAETKSCGSETPPDNLLALLTLNNLTLTSTGLRLRHPVLRLVPQHALQRALLALRLPLAGL